MPWTAIQVKLSEMQLRRARPYGNCWLGCELWRQLELDEFWERRLPRGREDVSWSQVLELLVVNRLIDPGSEFRVHRQWFDQSAMDVLLGVDFAVAEKDRLYRCLDRILAAPAGIVPASAAALEDSVRCAVRRAALRSDQHVRGRRGGAESESQAWLQPRRAAGLQAGGGGAGGHAGGLPAGLRSDGREHVGQDHAAGISEEDRRDLRQGAAGVADGSRDSDRGSAGGDAHLWAGDVLSGGHAARASGQVREAVARPAVAQGARLGGSEALQPGRRVVCAGQERGPAGEGDRDPAQEAGAAVVEAARHAAELSEAGPVTDAGGRGENRSRPGIRIREDPTATGPPSGDAPDVHFPTRQGQVTEKRNCATGIICCARIWWRKIRRCCGIATCSWCRSKRRSSA